MKELTKTELNNVINDQLKKKLPWEQPRKKPVLIRAAIRTLKMSRFYSSCIIGKSVFDLPMVKEDYSVDLRGYFLYKINRRYYKTLLPDDKPVVTGISSFKEDRKDHRILNKWYYKEPIKFFIDKYTLCVLKMNTEEDIVKIEFYGLHASEEIKKIRRILCCIKRSRDKTFEKKNGIYDEVSRKSILLTSFNKIVMDNNKKECIINSLENLIQTKEIYSKYNMIRKLGILLYGSPGTGKTSVIKAIISETKKMIANNFVFVGFIDVSLPLKEFRESFNHLEDRFNNYLGVGIVFIVIEEIDAILNESRDNDRSESNSKIKLLLEFLDGFSTPNKDIITLASTNYYEKLDPALVRAGRFDLKIELKDFNKDQAKEMLAKYDLVEDVKLFNGRSIDELDNFKSINPAILRNMIIDYIAAEYRKNLKENV